MIEDTQIETKMAPPIMNQQIQGVTTIGDKGLRKNGGGNMQPDGDKNKNSGVGYPKASGKKFVKNSRQGQRREQSFSKNGKKNSIVDSKNSRGFETNETDHTDIQSLINFQYAPVSRTFITGPQYYHGSRRKRAATFNKEAFLQANCHFVVDESKKYAVNAIDPDVLVDWEDIQLVYLPSHDSPSCPICLYPPVAGKITRCGHVFCWSCMLHYLKLSDKTWSKCPICHESVHQKDLKSVVSCVKRKFARLDKITMKLMKRSKDSLFAVPKEDWSDEVGAGFPMWKDDRMQSGYKLALSSKEKVLEKILFRERTELEVQLNQALVDCTGEECFIQSALDVLQIKIEEVKQSLGHSPIQQNTEKETNESSVQDKAIYGNNQYLANLLAVSEMVDEGGAFTDDEEECLSLSPIACAPESNEDVEVEVKLDQSPETKRFNRTTTLSESSTCSWDIGDHTHRGALDEAPIKDTASYYFYQAIDGQNIFIHSLNARCLIEEYGGLAVGPVKISGQIIDFECFTMTKELRKRFRYLSHLPLSCEFVIVELLLRPPVLSRPTIHNFMGEFKKRKDNRLKKLDEQKKFDRRAAALRDKQEGFRPIYYDDEDEAIHLDLTHDFPQQFSSPETPERNLPPGESTDLSSNGPSFAQILSTQQNSQVQLPVKKSGSNVWERPQIKEHSQPSRQPTHGNDSDEGPDLVAPSLKEMFSAAMFTAPIEVKNENESKVNKKAVSGGKKKKNKGTLLFATGGQRKY